MTELTTFITQSLAPAIAISASGLLTLGLHNRISVLGARVRELNRELMQPNLSPARVENLQAQVRNFLKRAALVRNASFSLYVAIGMMVLTAVGLAMNALYGPVGPLPVVTFLLGLLGILLGVTFEGVEIALVLQALKLDVDRAKQVLQEAL